MCKGLTPQNMHRRIEASEQQHLKTYLMLRAGQIAKVSSKAACKRACSDSMPLSSYRPIALHKGPLENYLPHVRRTPRLSHDSVAAISDNADNHFYTAALDPS